MLSLWVPTVPGLSKLLPKAYHCFPILTLLPGHPSLTAFLAEPLGGFLPLSDGPTNQEGPDSCGLVPTLLPSPKTGD
jgi:hypothetical protein